MILSYSIISSIILTFGYLSYRLLMAGQRQHSLNRKAILVIYATSLLAPLVILSVLLHHSEGDVNNGLIEIGELTGGLLAKTGEHESGISWDATKTLIFRIYCFGAIATALYFFMGVISLLKIIRCGEKTDFGTFTLILTEDSKNTGPFSWGRAIVMNRKDYEEFGDMILIHEHAHRSQRHWLDILLAYFTICLQWFNPAAWAMREELKAIHEYQADEMVMDAGVDIKEYQMLLLQKAAGYGYQSLANSLNHSKLQKRVTMMYKKKTSLKRRMFALALIPAIGAGIAVTAIPSVAGVLESLTEPSTAMPMATEVSNSTDAPAERNVYQAVEEIAEFPGGMEGLLTWLSNNIRYPEAAMKADVQGRVVVKFVIEADGSVSEPEIVKGVSPELDAEAMRVVKEMPKWTPSKVKGKAVASYFTLPVSFKLESDKKEESK